MFEGHGEMTSRLVNIKNVQGAAGEPRMEVKIETFGCDFQASQAPALERSGDQSGTEVRPADPIVYLYLVNLKQDLRA